MNLDAVRGRNAFARVAALPPGARADFPSLARQLPQMLQVNGLLASWAFLLAKGKAHHQAALAALVAHFLTVGLLHRGTLDAASRAGGGPAAVTESSLDEAKAAFLSWVNAGEDDGMSGSHLRQLTAEAVTYAGWLRRAAEAYLAGGPTAEEGRDDPAEEAA